MQSKGGLLLDLESKTSNRKHGNTHALSECKTNERPICFVDRAESIWCQLFYTSGPPIETRKDGNISIVEIYREDLPRFRCRKRRPNSCSCFVWALWSYWGGKALFPLAFFGPKMPLARTQSPTMLTIPIQTSSSRHFAWCIDLLAELQGVRYGLHLFALLEFVDYLPFSPLWEFGKSATWLNFEKMHDSRTDQTFFNHIVMT